MPQSTVLWNLKGALIQARSMWELTYAKGMNDLDAWQFVYNFCLENDEAALEPVSDRGIITTELAFLARWAHHGFGHIVTSHKYAAALMCSEASADIVNSAHLPWKSFVISVPNGLLSVGELEYQQIRLTFDCDGVYQMILIKELPYKILRLENCRESIEDLFDVKTLVDPLITDAHSRIWAMAKRLVIGLLLSMERPELVRGLTSKTRSKCVVHREGPPAHRVTFVGKPLVLDCRPAVHDYLSGRCSSVPSVQTLVRGHYKRQVIGSDKIGRKVIWIQPYWRGPEEALILARAYRVDERSSNLQEAI